MQEVANCQALLCINICGLLEASAEGERENAVWLGKGSGRGAL